MKKQASLLTFLLRQFPRGHLAATLALACVVGLAVVAPETGNSLPRSATTLDLALPDPTAAEAPPVADEPSREAALARRIWRELEIRPGDTLAGLLRAQGVSPAQIHELVSANKELRKLASIRPGEILRLDVDDQGLLRAVQYQPSRITSLTADLTPEGWQVRSETRDYERQVRYAEAVIDDSLFLAGQQAGMTDGLIMQLAGIFGWDIDFALDIRQGDRFRLLYEELYLDGEKVSDGNILMAEFWNRDRQVSAYRFEPRSGDVDYLDIQGNSLRKEFIRTPVAFTRISSRFSTGRYHPVLHKVRAHKGIDYAAPRGTPVKAAGDGKVVYAGNRGGYGRVVVIQHGQRYSTLYAHLNGYASGIRAGRRVKQGQTIGYVGSSGLATGPHLHYEFQVNGVHRDPLTVPLPKARGIPDEERKEFLVHASRLRNQLALHAEASRLASNDLR